jgi:hypothetical protein
MPDNEEALKLVGGVGLEVFDTVSSKMQAARTLAKSGNRSNVVLNLNPIRVGHKFLMTYLTGEFLSVIDKFRPKEKVR